MSSLWQDIAYGWRQLRRAPVFVFIAVLTLAIGIGINTIVFGWIQTLRQESLPGVKDSNRLAVFTTVFPDHEGHGISFPDMRDLAAHLDVFAGIAAFQRWPLWLGDESRQRWVWAQAVSGNLFEVLGVQAALAAFVLIGAGLCLKGFQRANIDIYSGFNPDRVLLVPLLFPFNAPEVEERHSLYRRLLNAVRAMPSIESASLCDWLPLYRGATGARITIPGYQPPPGEDLSVSNVFIAPDYFKTMQAALLEGREFTEADDLRAPARVIINQTMARRFWPGLSPIGRQITWKDRPVEIIGIARDFKYDQLKAPPSLFLFTSVFQFSGGTPLLHVRSRADPSQLSQQIDKLTRSLNPNVVPYRSMTLNQSLATATFLNRLAFIFLSALGGLALLLASLGIYGVLAYVVEQRTREIGLRMALGATRAGILGLVIQQGLTVVFAGLLLGLLLTAGSAGFVFQSLYGVRAIEASVYLTVTALFVLVALLACYLPARRATLVDPMVALRSE